MTPEQLLLVAFVASALVAGIKFAWMGLFKQPKPGKIALQIIAFVVSIGLAFLWRVPESLPLPSVDLFAFVAALLAQVGAIFLVATGIYTVLLDKLLTGLETLYKKFVG